MRIEELSPSPFNPITGLNGFGRFLVSLTCSSCVLHIIPYAWSVQSQSLVHFPSLTIPCLDDPEQIETDIALAREAFANASVWIDKIRGELKSLVDKVAKGEARASSPVLGTAALR
jgi:hypothetical protein